MSRVKISYYDFYFGDYKEQNIIKVANFIIWRLNKRICPKSNIGHSHRR